MQEDPASPEVSQWSSTTHLNHCDLSCHRFTLVYILMKIGSSKKSYFGPGHSVDFDDSGAAVSERPTVVKVETDVGLSDQIAKR